MDNIHCCMCWMEIINTNRSDAKRKDDDACLIVISEEINI